QRLRQRGGPHRVVEVRALHEMLAGGLRAPEGRRIELGLGIWVADPELADEHWLPEARLELRHEASDLRRSSRRRLRVRVDLDDVDSREAPDPRCRVRLPG